MLLLLLLLFMMQVRQNPLCVSLLTLMMKTIAAATAAHHQKRDVYSTASSVDTSPTATGIGYHPVTVFSLFFQNQTPRSVEVFWILSLASVYGVDTTHSVVLYYYIDYEVP